jgi:crotonobetainyl-CoA:carnitine CoA-transferase CaiB-like acyl-CoA transferase
VTAIDDEPVAEYDHPLLGQERATPMLGEHTREILTELGYDDASVDDYRARGVVTWPGDDYAFAV